MRVICFILSFLCYLFLIPFPIMADVISDSYLYGDEILLIMCFFIIFSIIIIFISIFLLKRIIKKNNSFKEDEKDDLDEEDWDNFNNN